MTGDTHHVHEWERGAHMRDAFNVDGRAWACAICGVYKGEENLVEDEHDRALAAAIGNMAAGHEHWDDR